MAEDAITCPQCGLEEAFDAHGERPPPLHECGEFRCNGCQNRYVFGKHVPRLVIEPWHQDSGLRWVRFRVQDEATKEDLYVFDLDPEYADYAFKSALSLTTRRR